MAGSQSPRRPAQAARAQRRSARSRRCPRSHQPLNAAKRVGEVGKVLDETSDCREERADGDAREKEHGARRAVVPCADKPIDDHQRSERAGEARQRNHGDACNSKPDVKGDRQHRAQRCAGRHAQRVGRRQRVLEERLKDHAGQGHAAADDGRGEHAREPRDEKHLGVHVVGEGDRAVEYAGQRDGRASDKQRQEADEKRMPPKMASHTVRRARASVRSGKWHDREMTRAFVKPHVRFNASKAANVRPPSARLSSRPAREPGHS